MAVETDEEGDEEGEVELEPLEPFDTRMDATTRREKHEALTLLAIVNAEAILERIERRETASSRLLPETIISVNA